MGYIRIYWDILGYIGKYLEILGNIGKYWEILGYIWKYWGILGHIGAYWDILGHIGTYWDILGHILGFWYFGVPEGILCDGGSLVVWHADLSTGRSGVRIPPSAGRPTEINHNKSERKVQKVGKC